MDRDWIKISFIYVGTVIGAGFASGREIVEFFGIYGLKGILGLSVAGVLFSLMGSLLLLKIYRNKIKGFDDLVARMFGKKFGIVLDIIMIISLYTGYSVMISGSGAIFKEELGASFTLGIITMVILSFIVFLFQLEGFSFISSALVPLLILGIVFTSLYLIIKGDHNLYGINEGNIITHKGNFFSSSLLYVGSNSLIIITVFSSLLPLIRNRKTAILGGVAGGIILYMLGLSILLIMLLHYPEIKTMDIPMLKISNYIGRSYRKFYAIILWIAIFTTAIANGSSFINRFANSRYKLPIATIFCISAIPLAHLGFAKLVSLIYPIFGFIGLIILVFILMVL
ncbi:MAG: hypothetical protein GX974_03310 [Clostridiales bacterium]|nr:hypothetical protein [Clostridiales bacterium]